MRLKFLGTGASEGVPSLFCNCRVCKNARKVKGKEIRSRACFMIDDDLLIDFPQDVFFDALRYDLDFTAIKYLLITHTHCDHYDYEDLFQRGPYCSVDRTNDILNVYANAAAKKISCRLVRLNATFVFTFVKSLGTGTYAKKKPPFISGRERLTLQVRRS